MTTRQLAANMERLVAHGLGARHAGGGDPLGHGRRAGDRHRHGGDHRRRRRRRAISSRRRSPSSARSCACARRLAWFERKPLFGRRIVVTRPRAQAAGFIDALTDLGADVLPCPTIEIVPPESWAPLDAAIGRLASYDWLVLTSVNGVAMFFDRLRERRATCAPCTGARIAAVGSETAAAVAARGLHVDVVPEEFRAEAVAEAMRDGRRRRRPRPAAARRGGARDPAA